MTAGVRERLPNRPVSETSRQRARGGDTAPLSVISLTVVSPIFSSGCDAHTAATIFDTEAASHGAKNRSPVSDPEKGILPPRDTGLRSSLGHFWRAARQRE